MSEKTVVLRTRTVGGVQEKTEAVNRKTSALDRVWMSSLWLGVGALVHAWFIGPDFDARSLWSWGYLFVWPLPMLAWLTIQMAMVGLVVVLVIAGVATAYWAAKALAEYVRGRQL